VRAGPGAAASDRATAAGIEVRHDGAERTLVVVEVAPG
jgi:hypothetical protein